MKVKTKKVKMKARMKHFAREVTAQQGQSEGDKYGGQNSERTVRQELASWSFQPRQTLWIISGLKTNFNPSLSHSNNLTPTTVFLQHG